MLQTRFRLRTLMIAAALVAVVLGGVVEAARLVWLRREYLDRASHHGLPWPPGLSKYHHQLHEKYAAAARRPWRAVPPDPPSPD